jgi:hypothetical protein
VFHHLGIQAPLETGDLFGISIHHVRGIVA